MWNLRKRCNLYAISIRINVTVAAIVVSAYRKSIIYFFSEILKGIVIEGLTIVSLRFIVSVFLVTCITAMAKPVFAVESHAAVLMYHRFGEDTYPSTSIKTEQFIQQLDFFSANGFTVWPLTKIIDHLQSHTFIPDKTIAITIDDAYQSVFQIAYPLMLDRKIPFTLFVSSGVVDKGYSSYMNWEQIKELVDRGVTLGNHTVNHLHLVEHKDRVESETLVNQERIEKMTGVKPLLFAYPYGEYDLDLANKIRLFGLTGFGQHSGPIGEKSDFWALPRFPVSEQFSNLNALMDKLNSLPMPVTEIKPNETITNVTMPVMMVTLQKTIKGKETLQCFASGQGAARIRWVAENRFTVQAKKPLRVRRSRYNCTIKDSRTGRYFWYSHLWLQPQISEH